MYEIHIFDNIRASVAIEVITIGDIKEARDKMQSLQEQFIPAELHKGNFGGMMYRNYPNPYAVGCVEEKDKCEQLYKNKNPEWVEYDIVLR